MHRHIWEIYMVAHGQAEIRVEQRTISQHAGDVIVIEPGEAHTFLSASLGYLHFVVHSAVSDAGDKRLVSREALGLA